MYFNKIFEVNLQMCVVFPKSKSQTMYLGTDDSGEC